MANVALRLPRAASDAPKMPPHIWQSRPLPRPSSPVPTPVSDHHDPAPSPPPASHVWAPEPPPYNLAASSLPNLPSLPTVGPQPASPSPSPEIDLGIDADAVFRDLLNLQIDPHSQPHDHLHRSASLHSQPFHPSHHQQHHRQPTRLPSSSTNDLATDVPLHHYLSSSTGMLSLQPAGANHSVYTTSGVDGGPAPRGSPILRPSSVPPSSSAIPLPLAMSALQSATQPAPRIKNELYKTEICRSYAETGGFCKYGAKCQFAHGDVELRPVRRHPRYKTKLCRNFVTTGKCPYDSRCRFIHASDLPYAQAVAAGAGQAPGVPITGASASALAHHAQAQLRQGHTLLGGDAQHGVNVQDDYADNLRFLNLASSPNTAAIHLDHYVDTINADQRSASPPGELQPDKPIHSVLPTDQVYQSNANVFQDYSDNNAFHTTFMHLSGVDPDVRFAPSDLSDRDPVHTTHHITKPVANSAVGGNDSIIGSHFASTSDPQHESLFSHPGTNNRGVSPPGSATKGTIGSRVGNGTEFVEGNTHLATASSTMPRSRLPVFRNMAADTDAP